VKNIKIFIYSFIFLINSNLCLSQNIFYADLETVIKKSIAGKKITTHFDNKNKILLNEIKDFEIQVKKKEETIISQKNIIQSDEYLKKINLLNAEVKNFNTSSNDRINQININKNKTLNSLMLEINKILKQFAEQNKIDIILNSNQMLIGKSNLDITNELLQMVDESLKNFEIK